MDTLMEFSIQGDIFFFYDTLSDERRLPHHLWRLYRVNFYTEKFQNPVNKQILHKIFGIVFSIQCIEGLLCILVFPEFLSASDDWH